MLKTDLSETPTRIQNPPLVLSETPARIQNLPCWKRASTSLRTDSTSPATKRVFNCDEQTLKK